MNEIEIVDNMESILRAISGLEKNQVLVGVPSDHADREDGAPINNAELAYINENGSPSTNLPARPSLIPGVKKVLPEVSNMFKRAGNAALDGNDQRAHAQLEAIGIKAAASVRATLTAGEGFAPLTTAALKSRLYRARKGLEPGKKFTGKKAVRQELAIRAGLMERPEDFVGVKPLNDTGELRRSFTYVVPED